MITERTLKQWRKESLKAEYKTKSIDSKTAEPVTEIKTSHLIQLHQRIDKLTQELMDIKLVMK